MFPHGQQPAKKRTARERHRDCLIGQLYKLIRNKEKPLPAKMRFEAIKMVATLDGQLKEAKTGEAPAPNVKGETVISSEDAVRIQALIQDIEKQPSEVRASAS